MDERGRTPDGYTHVGNGSVTRQDAKPEGPNGTDPALEEMVSSWRRRMNGTPPEGATNTDEPPVARGRAEVPGNSFGSGPADPPPVDPSAAQPQPFIPPQPRPGEATHHYPSVSPAEPPVNAGEPPGYQPPRRSERASYDERIRYQRPFRFRQRPEDGHRAGGAVGRAEAQFGPAEFGPPEYAPPNYGPVDHRPTVPRAQEFGASFQPPPNGAGHAGPYGYEPQPPSSDHSPTPAYGIRSTPVTPGQVEPDGWAAERSPRGTPPPVPPPGQVSGSAQVPASPIVPAPLIPPVSPAPDSRWAGGPWSDSSWAPGVSPSVEWAGAGWSSNPAAPPYVPAEQHGGPPAPPAPPIPAEQPDHTAQGLPQRVPSTPDVPAVPGDETGVEGVLAETPELARIADYLRDEELAEDRRDGVDIPAVLAAARGVPGVRGAEMVTTNDKHTLRLDLADDWDPIQVSRAVARLLKEQMNVSAEPSPHAPVAPEQASNDVDAAAPGVGSAATTSLPGPRTATDAAPDDRSDPPNGVGLTEPFPHADPPSLARSAGGSPSERVEEPPAAAAPGGSPLPAAVGRVDSAQPTGHAEVPHPAGYVEGAPHPTGPAEAVAGPTGRPEAVNAAGLSAALIGQPERTNSAAITESSAALTGRAEVAAAARRAEAANPNGHAEVANPNGHAEAANPNGHAETANPNGHAETAAAVPAATNGAATNEPVDVSDRPEPAGMVEPPELAAASEPVPQRLAGLPRVGESPTAADGLRVGAVSYQPGHPGPHAGGRPPDGRPLSERLAEFEPAVSFDDWLETVHPGRASERPVATADVNAGEPADAADEHRSLVGMPMAPVFTDPSEPSGPAEPAAGAEAEPVLDDPTVVPEFQPAGPGDGEPLLLAPGAPALHVAGTGGRIRLDQVEVTSHGMDALVHVRLSAGAEVALGSAVGPAVDQYVLRLCATATANALDTLLTDTETGVQGGRCYIEHATVVSLGNCDVALVVLLLVTGGWVEQLTGSALVAGDSRQAVVRATLAAANRRLDALLP